MRKHDCVVIGDSLAAIHAAVQFAGAGFPVLLVRPDISPVELYETSKGTFECDIASGCDLSYYFNDIRADDLYGFRNNLEVLPYPYRTRTPRISLDEPGHDDAFLREIPSKIPGYNESILRFHAQISYLHDLVNEIEAKTGLIPKYSESSMPKLFTKLDPVTFANLSRMMNTSFKTMLSRFSLPEELMVHYTLICNDHLGLSPDSVDAITGAEVITRRRHGLNRPDSGWIALKDAMLEALRKRDRVSIIGGKRIDLVKSSAGFVFEIYIDERNVHPVDWLVIDESIGMLGFEGSTKTQGRFTPLGFYSRSHLDFKLCIGWSEMPPQNWQTGVNFVYTKTEFPHQAPHMVRVDVMPPESDNRYELKSKLTIRGRYPVERITTSWGQKVNRDELQDELMQAIKGYIPMPESEPVFAKLILPENYSDPFGDMESTIYAPREFRNLHKNVRLINASGINGGNMRFAFRSAERIAREIGLRVGVRRFFEDIALKPIVVRPGFIDSVSRDLRE